MSWDVLSEDEPKTEDTSSINKSKSIIKTKVKIEPFKIDSNKMLVFLKTLDEKQYPMLKNLIYRAKTGRKSAYISELIFLVNRFGKEIAL